MQRLQDLRSCIDNVDEKIILLIKERMELVKKVGLLKAESSLPVLDINRWNAVLIKRRELATKLDINPDLIEKIYHLIHGEALKEEEKFITK